MYNRSGGKGKGQIFWDARGKWIEGQKSPTGKVVQNGDGRCRITCDLVIKTWLLISANAYICQMWIDQQIPPVATQFDTTLHFRTDSVVQPVRNPGNEGLKRCESLKFYIRRPFRFGSSPSEFCRSQN